MAAVEKLPEQTSGAGVWLVSAWAVGEAGPLPSTAPHGFSGESVVHEEDPWELGSFISWLFCNLPPVVQRRMLGWCGTSRFPGEALLMSQGRH